MTASEVALVVGASGIMGHALVEPLLENGGRKVRAARPSFVPNAETLNLDLNDAGPRDALAAAGDTTHVFYAAMRPDANLGREAEIKGAMLRNLLDGLKAAGANPQRVERYRVYAVRQLVGWLFGDFIFNTEFDMVLDMGKIRRAGFTEAASTENCLIGALRRLGEKGYIPRFHETSATRSI